MGILYVSVRLQVQRSRNARPRGLRPRAGASRPLRALRARRGDCLWTPFGLPLASGRQETFFEVTVTPCNETAPYVYLFSNSPTAFFGLYQFQIN